MAGDTVRAWEETVIIPTYPAPPPDKNPMFLDKRVYQGSSGKVYPNPFTDRISDTRMDHSYRAVYLENEYVRLMILPEIGGRIHAGLDKTRNYDFFYRQHVIKPALVGLLGPWISGGVEFNWPQHHRPSTFMPVEHSIEQHPDGSRTVWLTEHEPMNRMQGTVGICLYPGRSLVEAKVRLYNRTPFVQTFLWWANAGIRVHDHYQAFFPPDVNFVADHARRAVSRYPLARDFYYGVDYTAGVDISWYRNIPVPTSYMVTKSNYDFFGGYDHAKRAGLVHVANHHIAPGKKLWTWGNAAFGYAWDRELTDSDGPYIELMAGVFTDNQPDFSWLAPYETRTFRQFWYPIQDIGPAKNANRRLAVNLEQRDGEWRVGVCPSEVLRGLRVVLTANGDTVLDKAADAAPGRPFIECVRVSQPGLLLRVFDAAGRELIRYAPEPQQETEMESPATEPPPPESVHSPDELYVYGLHLEQYRHATRDPETYWREALRRDPADARSNNALGLAALRRGQFAEAERHFRAAVARLTLKNRNPRDGEPFYNLGLSLKYQVRLDDAYAAFYKAVWNYAWQAAAYYQLAAIDSSRGDHEAALEHLEASLRADPANAKARTLEQAIRRRLGRGEPAPALAAPVQTLLDFAFDSMEAGLWGEAADLLERAPEYPMVLYALGYAREQQGGQDEALEAYHRAGAACPDYCFPSRLEEMLVLEGALRANPDDARAYYYLGNLLYDKQRREEAIGHWERACALDPGFSIPWRNLGIAYYNVRKEPGRALECYANACRANPSDSRLLYEIDQLRKRSGAPPEARLKDLEAHPDLTAQRDDLTVELVTLYNQTGRSEEALRILAVRRFHPWEGGEGLASGQYVAAHLLLGRAALDANAPAQAMAHFDAARTYPPNLGEGKHLLTDETQLDYYAGIALARLGRPDDARDCWRRAAGGRNDYYRALALRELGEPARAGALLEGLIEFANRQMLAEVRIDYFATSLPNFLTFDDDLETRNRVDCLFLRALGHLGLGLTAAAAADLRELLALDRNHLWARKELERLA